MFDAHRHLSSDTSSFANAIYATASIGQWQQAAALSTSVCIGAGALANEPLPTAEDLYSHLVAHPALQVGEVGLDRRYPDSEAQEHFLCDAIKIASELDRLLILHVVRRDGRAIELLRSFGSTLPRVLWHGCTASVESRKILAQLGVIVSYGPTLFESAIARDPATLCVGQWVLESDWEALDEQPYTAFYTKHVHAFAALTGLSVERVVKNNDAIRAILTDQPPPR